MIRKTRLFFAALAALAGVAGCSSQSPSSETREESVRAIATADTAAVGTLCAAGATGGQFCAPSTGDPGVLWKQAAGGGLPIQMWAQWPSNLTIDQLVSSTAALQAWFADMDKVLAYVRDTQKNAESYRATMAGNMGGLLAQARAEQQRLLAQPLVDPVGDLKTGLNAKATAEKSPILAQIAADKQTIGQVSVVLSQATANLVPLQTAFASISAQYAAYHGTEAAETAAYKTLAQQASAATLQNISVVEQSVVTEVRSASTAPGDLELSIMRTAAQLQAFELRFDAAIAPYQDFMTAHGVARPDMTSSALRSLDAMLGYVRGRTDMSDATASQILTGIEARREALVTLATTAATRQTLAQTQLLAASSTFTDQSSARISALWATPPTSATLKLPYLSDRIDRFTAFLQLQPLCAPASSSWRETGCVSLRTNFNTASSYLTNTIPLLMKLGVAKMKTAGVDATLLASVTTKLAAGDTKGAAIAYDAAVHASEAQ